MYSPNLNKAVIMSPLKLLANSVNNELSSKLTAKFKGVKSPVFVNTSEVYNILQAANKKASVVKNTKQNTTTTTTTTTTKAQSPQTQSEVLAEVEEITIDSSDIGKGLASDAQFVADFAIPRKYYSLYLLRQVYLSVDRSTMDNVLLWGFADIDDVNNTKKFITSPSQPYSHLFFLHPANKQSPESALPIKKGNNYVKERSSTLVFKALPPVVLKAEKLQVFEGQGFKGLLKHTLKISTYKDLMNQYKPLVLAYDDWQRSIVVPLSAEGHAKISSHILDPDQFESFLSSNAETYVEAADLYAQAVLKSKAKNIPSNFNIAKHDRSELMSELTQHIDSNEEQPSVAVSPDGNSKTSVIFGADIETKYFGFIQNIQEKHDFIILEKLGLDFYFYKNVDGNSVVYTDACNEDGSVRVSSALVKRGGKNHIAMVSVNRITDSKLQKQLRSEYVKYKALVDAYNNESTEAEESTEELNETNGLPDIDLLPEGKAETVSTKIEELPDIDPLADTSVDDILPQAKQQNVTKAPSSVKQRTVLSVPPSRNNRRGTVGQRN